MASINEQLRSQENFAISRDYSRPAESYHLCSEADLVIAKHTSLVDECMSWGIPCLLHDYAENYTRYAQSTLIYLPEKAWVQSFQELCWKLEEILPVEGRSVTRGQFDGSFHDMSLSHEHQVLGKLRKRLLEA